jgi:hypothetical protein
MAATAAVVPLLAGAPPAGAATASDTDERDVTFSSFSGDEEVTCRLFAQHSVDTESGHLEANLSVSGDSRCEAREPGRLYINVEYTDTHGDPAEAFASASGDQVRIIVLDAGRTEVAVYYTVLFSPCRIGCDQLAQTNTK